MLISVARLPDGHNRLHPPADDEGLLARAAHAVMLALLGPVALMVGVRWWLQFRLDRLPESLPPGAQSGGRPCWAAARWCWWCWAAPLFGLLAPGGWCKPWCATPLQRKVLSGLLVAWVLLAGVGTAQAVRSRSMLVCSLPAPKHCARGAEQVRPACARQAGARLYLDWPAEGGLHTVTIEAPEALLRQPFRAVAVGRRPLARLVCWAGPLRPRWLNPLALLPPRRCRCRLAPFPCARCPSQGQPMNMKLLDSGS